MRRQAITALLILTPLMMWVAATCSPGDATISGGNPLTSAVWERREITGRVVHHQQAGNYTYLLMETPNERAWAVIAEPLPGGRTHLRLRLYASLEGYTSRRLNQTFDRLHFAALVGKETP